jgi:hypothetical protein
LLIHWDNIVADWYTQTLALSTHLGKYDSTSAEWAKHIAEVGKIVQDAAVFQAEIESIAQPETIEEAKQLIRIAKRSTATLNLLVQDIQAQNYKRLWTTLKYRDLISGDFS